MSMLPLKKAASIALSEVTDAGPPTYLLNGYIPERFSTILYGEGGVGKSNFAMAWAICIATGLAFCGVETKQARAVLYVDFELSEWVQKDRASRIARGLDTELPSNLLYLQP